MKSTQSTPYNPRRTRRHMGHFGRLALLYYPDRGYKHAVHLFREEIRLSRSLFQALLDLGYKDNQRILNKCQLEVIEEYLGDRNERIKGEIHPLRRFALYPASQWELRPSEGQSVTTD